jgi:hypothetical protein
MSEDQINRNEPVASLNMQALPDDAGALIRSARMNMPRAPRTAPSRSYCAETAWVWQRARLVCAVKESTT